MYPPTTDANRILEAIDTLRDLRSQANITRRLSRVFQLHSPRTAHSPRSTTSSSHATSTSAPSPYRARDH